MVTPGEEDREPLENQAETSDQNADTSTPDSDTDVASANAENTESSAASTPEREKHETEEPGDEDEEDEEGDEEDDDSARPHVQGRSVSAVRDPRERTSDGFQRPLAGKSNIELRTLYIRSCEKHEEDLEKGEKGAQHLNFLAQIRDELKERAMADVIKDVLLPLLAHLNPCVQVISAMDILSRGSEAFTAAHQASQVLRAARHGRSGFATLLAKEAIASYADAKVAPQLATAPEVILDQTSGRYAAARAQQLPPSRSRGWERGRGR